MTFEIQGSHAYVEAWKAKTAKANNRCERNGLGRPFTMTYVKDVETKRRVAGVEVKATEYVWSVEGDSPSLPGWRFAATLDWSTEVPVVRTSPTYQGPALPRPTEQVCEHCGTKRTRNDTFLVTDPQGDIKQVGRQCLAAYTGIPLGWVYVVEGLSEGDGDEREYWKTAPPVYDTVSLLRLAVQITDAIGYVSKANADDMRRQSTAAVFQLLWHGGWTQADREEAKRLAAVIEEAKRDDDEVNAEVAQIIVWATKQHGSDYLQNLAAILGEEVVTMRNIGYAVSAVPTYRRAHQREVERKAKRAAAAPVTAGRQVIEGEITKRDMRDTQYGTVTKIMVRTDAGSMLWGTLPSSIYSATPGTRVRFTATVEVSDRDNTFGFFARPAKAVIV